MAVTAKAQDLRDRITIKAAYNMRGEKPCPE